MSMEKYIEHSSGNSVFLIPVDPSASLQVDFVASENPACQGRGDINAKVGNLSFLLYGDVGEEKSGELISAFVKKYKAATAEQNKEKEYVSTKWVVVGCLLAVSIVLYFSDTGNDASVLNRELAKVKHEVFSPSEKVVDELMDIPPERIIDVMDAKERYLLALKEMKDMDAKEREAFINTPQMQELINTSWVEHIQEE